MFIWIRLFFFFVLFWPIVEHGSIIQHRCFKILKYIFGINCIQLVLRFLNIFALINRHCSHSISLLQELLSGSVIDSRSCLALINLKAPIGRNTRNDYNFIIFYCVIIYLGNESLARNTKLAVNDGRWISLHLVFF